MNDTAVAQIAAIAGSGKDRATGGGTIRRQLVWASLFPLAFFGLLSMLAMASALEETTLKLVMQRNAAQAQASANIYALATAGQDSLPIASATLKQLGVQSADAQLLIINASGIVISKTGPSLMDISLIPQEAAKLAILKAPQSSLITSQDSGDQIVIAYAPVPGTDQALLMFEPWSLIMTPAYYYQWMLLALLTLGTVLSLIMLSASIGRLIRPIMDLSHAAAEAVPGSIFRPVPERGPVELRSLTASFNQMVIKLAEQQATMRQYAQKALLSQEEERRRLSHELHDGTVQDLVGLAQRIELCRSEMDRDPLQAQRRLDELKALAQHTLHEVRNISNALRPSILQDLGLAAALQVLCRDLEGQLPCVHSTYQLNGLPRRLQPEMELAVFRVAQEALTNIRRHARDAEHVSVCLDFQEGGVQLEVQDDGPGTGQPDVGALVRSGHLGYAGMYERARLFGGKLNVESGRETGTSIRMILPYQGS